MNKYLASSALALGSLLLAFTSSQQEAEATPESAEEAPSPLATWFVADGNVEGDAPKSQVVASNVAGTTDKILTLIPHKNTTW